MNSAVVTGDEPSTAPQIAYGREFWLAYFANTLLIVCNSSLFRYFDFVSYLGGDEYDLGLITGFGMGGAVLTRFVQGAVIDRFGTRVVWLGSLCLLLSAILGHFVVDEVNGTLIYFLRLCYMVGLAGAFGASITAISLKAPKGRSTELIGVLGSSGFVGLAIGPLIGDIIFAGEAAIEAKIKTMFIVALCAGIVSLILAYLATRGDKPQRSSGHPSLFRLIREYHPGWMLAMAFAMGFGVLIPQIFLRSYAKEIGIEHISSFFLVYAITAFTCRLITRKVPERIGVKNAATIGILLLSFSLTLYLLASNPWLLPVPAIVGGMAHALIFPAIIGGGSIAFPKKYRGTGTNLMLVMLDLGGLFGQPLIGVMIASSRKAELPAYPITFVSVAALLAVIALLNQRFAKPIISQEEDQPVLEERSHCVNESLQSMWPMSLKVPPDLSHNGNSRLNNKKMSGQLAAFLAGENDDEFIEEIVDGLFQSQSNSPHPEVHYLLDAWETSDFLHSNGFEILFEQGRPFQDWLDIFNAINFQEAIPILQKVNQLVPEHIYLPEFNTETRRHIDNKFDELKACAYEFYDLGDVFTARVGDYIRAHAKLMLLSE